MKVAAVTLVLGTLALGLPPQAAGQTIDPFSIAEGRKVRVQAAGLGEGWATGSFLGYDDDALLVRMKRPRGIVRIPVSLVERLEVATRRSNTGRGALYGSLCGAAVGGLAVVGFARAALIDSAGDALQVVAVPTAVGAGLGAVVGSLFRTEHWTVVPVGRTRVTVAPQAGRGLGLAVTVEF